MKPDALIYLILPPQSTNINQNIGEWRHIAYIFAKKIIVLRTIGVQDRRYDFAKWPKGPIWRLPGGGAEQAATVDYNSAQVLGEAGISQMTEQNKTELRVDHDHHRISKKVSSDLHLKQKELHLCSLLHLLNSF